jgi:hypothetical protein
MYPSIRFTAGHAHVTGIVMALLVGLAIFWFA